MNRGPDEEAERNARIRQRNRRALLWITVWCLALASVGYVFARWLMTQPPQK
ncbi:MAG TPA: hypothetical protein VJW75_00080 [Candidatus Eisenbacteria bacterium]|nr:hypothetical protein [Candidatus Eisenbacteria bacterium]